MTHKYIYQENNTDKPTFVLLHGTGGDENSLLRVAELLNPDYNVLSIRGNVNENGMNRYFKRHGEGHYDIEDLNKRGAELFEFIKNFGKENKISLENMIPVGFSNGSNIAINFLLNEEAVFKKAILMAPLYSIEIPDGPDLSHLQVFLSMGEHDPISSVEDSKRVVELFEERGAEVTEEWTETHSVTGEVLAAARDFLNNK